MKTEIMQLKLFLIIFLNVFILNINKIKCVAKHCALCDKLLKNKKYNSSTIYSPSTFFVKHERRYLDKCVTMKAKGFQNMGNQHF